MLDSRNTNFRSEVYEAIENHPHPMRGHYLELYRNDSEARANMNQGYEIMKYFTSIAFIVGILVIGFTKAPKVTGIVIGSVAALVCCWCLMMACDQYSERRNRERISAAEYLRRSAERTQRNRASQHLIGDVESQGGPHRDYGTDGPPRPSCTK